MEERLNKLTVNYIGNIANESYFNVDYTDGFGPNTSIKVSDTCTCCNLDSRLEYNVAKYDAVTTRTLVILNQKEENLEYSIKLYESDVLIEEVSVKSDPTDVPALIKDNVSVKSIGDRIIEVIFDEPVQNLEANFDFAKDRLNYTPLALTNNGHYILTDGTLYYANISTTSTPNFVLVNSDASEGSAPTTIPDINALTRILANGLAVKAVIAPYPLTPSATVPTLVPDGIKLNQSCYVKYTLEYSKESNGESSVLLNYYFRYYGTDDEGTLYEPIDKPINWLGYFASKDTTTRVSDDKRKIEIQFDSYSLPTASVNAGDVPHQLIINYAKTFPNYQGRYRILDANENPFPIIREAVEITKLANRAAVTKVEAISRDDILVYFDKPVLCQEYNLNNNYKVITINGAIPETVERYNNSYNILRCHLNSNDALDVGNDIPVSIGSIIDACGYTTLPFNAEIVVVVIPPKVISLTQSQKSTEESTILDIVFSDEMKTLSGEISKYFEIYKIVDGIEEIIYPTISVTDFETIDGKTHLEVSVQDPILYPGYIYKIKIADMVNVYNVVMIPYEKTLHIKDMSAPIIKAIYLTTHDSTNPDYFDPVTEGYKIAVIFNEPMTNEGIHSLTNCNNYAITIGDGIGNDACGICSNTPNVEKTKICLSHENTEGVVSLKENTIARICLVKDCFDILPFTEKNLVVKAGHCDLKDVKYLTNKSGNVLNFVCSLEEQMSLKVNLNKPTTNIYAINNETIIIDYVATNNEMLKIDPSAFSVKKTTSSDAVLAIDGEVISANKLSLTFPENTFVDPDKKLYVDANGEDLFGNYMVAVDALNISYNSIPMLTKAYKYHRHGDIVVFALEFNEPVKVIDNPYIAAKDYSISINGNPAKAGTLLGRLVNPDHKSHIQVEAVDGPSKTLFLQLTNSDGVVFLPTDKFTISVNADQFDFKTVDAQTNSPVEIFSNKDANTPYPLVGGIAGNYCLKTDNSVPGTPKENLIITYGSDLGLILDGYALDNVKFLNPLAKKIADTPDTTDYWEITYHPTSLFNSFSITITHDDSPIETNKISLPDVTPSYDATTGTYSLIFSGIGADITPSTLKNVDIGVSNAFTTVEGIATANNSVHCNKILLTHHTNPTSYTLATLDFGGTEELDKILLADGTKLKFNKGTLDPDSKFIVYTADVADSVKLFSEIIFNFETAYVYNVNDFANSLVIDVTFENGKYKFGTLTNDATNNGISITGTASITVVPQKNIFTINNVPIPAVNFTSTQGTNI